MRPGSAAIVPASSLVVVAAVAARREITVAHSTIIDSRETHRAEFHANRRHASAAGRLGARQYPATEPHASFAASRTFNVQQIFQDRRQYRVPFYQRSDVSNREDQRGRPGGISGGVRRARMRALRKRWRRSRTLVPPHEWRERAKKSRPDVAGRFMTTRVGVSSCGGAPARLPAHPCRSGPAMLAQVLGRLL